MTRGCHGSERSAASGTYSYGATNAADPGGLYVNAFKPHAVSAAGVFNYAYDASGNMTERRDVLFNTSSHFSWTRFGKISQMWRNAATPDAGLDLVTLTYDADGQRIRQESSTKTTDYLAGLYERRRSASGVVEHIYNIDNDLRTVAQLTVSEDGASSSSELLFIHADHLGSAELLTQSDGSVAERRSYRAFGGARDPNDWSASQSPDDAVVRSGFTGHEREDEYGLVNMVGRYYDPALQRFLSADPFVMRPFDSQSINRYSYVSNNPLGYVDPSGWSENDLDAGELPPLGATNIELRSVQGGWQYSWTPASGTSGNDMEFGKEFAFSISLPMPSIDVGWEPGGSTVDLSAFQNTQFAQVDSMGPAGGGALADNEPGARNGATVQAHVRGDPNNVVDPGNVDDRGYWERVHENIATTNEGLFGTVARFAAGMATGSAVAEGYGTATPLAAAVRVGAEAARAGSRMAAVGGGVAGCRGQPDLPPGRPWQPLEALAP